MMSSNEKSREKEFVFCRLLIPKGHTEAVYDHVWSEGPLGVETEVEDENIEIARVYFESLPEAEELKSSIVKSGLEVVVLEDGQVHYRDWESFLHGGFEPLEVGDIIVVPAENPPAIPEGKKPLYIIPGRGFGTGSHSTTRLCLKAMAEHLEPGLCCFDVGAGSGILSIAAMLMGAEKVDGVEIDPDSVINAHENLELNSFSDNVDIKAGSIDLFSGKRYPLILINIISKVILDLVDQGLLDYLNENGRMIVSGVLSEEAVMFIRKMEEAGLRAVWRGEDKEWSGFVFVRK